jgi:hypothetical protein
MSEAGLTQENSDLRKRGDVCFGCERRAHFFARETGLNHVFLDSKLTVDDRKRIDQEIADVEIDEWKNYQKFGVPIGRYAGYEFTLENKLSNLNLSKDTFPYYINQLRNTSRSLQGWLNLIDDCDFDVVIVTNDLYSVNRAASSAAKLKGRRVYNLSNGADLRLYSNSISFSDNGETDLLSSRHNTLSDFTLEHMSPDLITQVGQHFKELSAGKNAFSYTSRSGRLSSTTIREKLGIPQNHSVVLVLTSSSDERVAADLVGIREHSIQSNESALFANTTMWLRWIIENANRFSEITFVIRVHPRLFPNKREGVLAEAAETLKSLLSVLPSNVRVNWPSDKIGLYDLATITRSVLNHTSSAGVEMLSLGLPVIQHDPEGLYAYPHKLNVTPKDLESYSRAILDAVRRGPELKNIENAYLWKGWLFSVHARNVHNRFPIRSKWSLMRIVNGLSLRSAMPIPQWLLVFAETFEFRRRKIDNEVETALETVISNEHKSFSDLFESRKVLQSSSAARTQVLRTQQSVLTKVYPLGKRQDNDIYQWFFWMKKNQSSRKFSKPIN